MPPIVIKISIEGDAEGSIEALRRIAAMSTPGQPLPYPGFDHSEAVVGIEEEEQVDSETSSTEIVPNRYRPMWGNYGMNMAYRPIPAEPTWPAQWDSQLGKELVRNMSESARRLVATLATAGSEGMTRDDLTTELGIENDNIRTTQVSIGHALRRLQRANGNISLPRPVEFHKRLDTYMLNPGFREAIQDAAG